MKIEQPIVATCGDLELTVDTNLNTRLSISFHHTDNSYIGSFQVAEYREQEAKKQFEKLAKVVNMHTEAMDIILEFVRKHHSDTQLVKKAVALLNKNKE